MRILLVVLAVVFADPALALTGQEVWRQWQAEMAGDGWILKQSKVEDLDSGIRVEGIVVAHDSGATVSLSQMTISDAPGMDVRIAFGREMKVYWPLLVEPGIVIESDGAVLLSSPQSGGQGFTLAADKLAVRAGDRDSAAARLVLVAVTGRFSMAAKRVEQVIPVEMALDAANAIVEISDNDPARDFAFEAGLPGLGLVLTGNLPPQMAGPNDMSAEEAFRAGFSFDLAVKHGAMIGHLESGQDEMSMTGLACDHNFAMAQTGFSLRDECGAAEVKLVTGLPAEAVVSLQKLLVQINAPVNSMQAAANLNFLFTLEGAAVNEAVWALIDTKKALPHGPMDFAMDLGMLARWNIFDEATTDDFKPEAVDLRRFEVKAAGVEAAFSGRGTVDQMAGEDDVPFSEAVLDGKVSGLNRLLNAAVDAGLVAAGDLFPVRMGLSMIFNPGVGEDVLTTHVEARAGGEVFVNGVQMK